MEGRDSAQLIYRWTKQLDPNLRHGSWTAEEDAVRKGCLLLLLTSWTIDCFLGRIVGNTYLGLAPCF